MNDDEVRRRAQVRAIAFLEASEDEIHSVERLTRELVEFVFAMLVGDISDGAFIHWLHERPRMKHFASVACGRTFDLYTRAGRSSVNEELRFVTCPKCRAIGSQ